MQSSQATPATPPGGPETALVQRLRHGDGAAFEELLRAHGGHLLAVARRLLGNEEDARDTVQDAFLSAFRSIDRFDGQAALATWLHRIAVNAALTRLRSRRRRPEKPIEELLPTFLEDGHQARPSRDWPDPSAALQRHETREAVRRHIAELPDDYRAVLLLRDIEGLDTEETARLLGLKPGAVKTRLHRARQALRTLLEPEFCGGEPVLTCREFVEFLMAYLADELPAGQRAVFEEHLGECPDCTSYLYSYQKTVQIEKIACGCDDPPPAGVPEELIRAILAARAQAK